MTKNCPDCGCKMYNGRCVNCHEELYIIDQYQELSGTEFELPFPNENSDFMKKAHQHEKDIKRNRLNKYQ